MEKLASERFEVLDAMRGLAAISVVIYHVGLSVGAPVLPGAFLSVDLFFVMSGFVIAHSYDRKMTSLGILGFMRARLIRLYPLYLVGTLLGLAVLVVYWTLTDHPPNWLYSILGAAILNLAFIPAPPMPGLGDFLFPIDTTAWSLMLEMAINLAYALLFRVLSRGALLGAIFLSAAALIYLASQPMYIHSGVEYSQIGGGFLWSTVWAGAPRAGFSFPLGVLMYRARHQMPNLARLRPLLLPLFLAAIFLKPSFIKDLTFVFVVSPFIVLLAADARDQASRISRFLGSISYGLYIIHAPVLAAAMFISDMYGVSPVGPLLVGAMVSVFAAYLLDKYYDRPVRRWLTDATRWRAGQQEAVS